MVQDQLTRSEVETALQDCDVIEDYPATHRPLPDCLVLGYLQGQHPIHAVIAIDQVRDRIFVVTVYRPSAERWADDCERENRICPTCGGRLHPGVATIPFILSDNQVIVLKGVPAETCGDCHAPFMSGKITDEVMVLVSQLRRLGSEISVVSFRDYAVT